MASARSFDAQRGLGTRFGRREAAGSASRSQGCEGAGEPDTALDGTEKHDATVRGHASAIKRGADFLAVNRWETEGQQSILQHSWCGSRDNVDGMLSTPTL